MSTPKLPDRARAVVIGGGVIGTSVAYHLAHDGLEGRGAARARQADIRHDVARRRADGDVRLDVGNLDRDAQVHARSLQPARRRRRDRPPASMPVGFIEVAADADRLEEYRRVAAFNRYCGVDVHEISPAEVKRLFPLARTDDILAGFYVKEDGRANPVDVDDGAGQGRAHGRRAHRRRRGRHRRPAAERPRHRRADERRATSRPKYVVNCAGMWARQLGERGRRRRSPTRRPSTTTSSPRKSRTCRRTCRCWRIPPPTAISARRAAACWSACSSRSARRGTSRAFPDDFSFGEIPPDWDRMAPYLEKAMSRVPVTLEAGIKKLFCGPESFTPDLRPIVGEAPELQELLRRRRPQLDRHPDRRRPRPGARALDRQRRRPTWT